MEQEEYTKEEIDWSYIEFVDNQDVLDLIEKKPGGIIALLDEACMFPRSTHETFAQKLYQTFKDHKRFSKPKLARSDFTIYHYAGEVTYQTDLFLDKNKDYVVAEHQALLSASQCPFVAGLFPPLSEDSSKSSKFSSIGSRFKQQLQTLLETLNATEPHYIRCVKPNNLLKPGIFENANVLQQLRCGGVMEAIRISCAGFPTRRTFGEFVGRFGTLDPTVLDGSCDEMTASKRLLAKANLKDYQIGKTKVFLRAGQMPELDSRRNEVLGRSAAIIQRKVRTYLARKWFISLKKSAIEIQAICRGKLGHQRFENMRRQAACIRIQTCARKHAARKSYKELCRSSITIQAGYHGMVARRELLFKRQTRAAVIIQSKCRQYLSSKHFKMIRKAAVTAQCACRMELARRELLKLKKAARETQALQAAKEELERQVEELTNMLQLEEIMRADIEEAKIQETTKLQSNLEEIQSQLEAKTQELVKLQSTLEDIQSQFEAKSQEMTKLQSALEEIQPQLETKTQELVKRQSTLEDIQSQFEAKSQETTKMQSTLEEIQSQLEAKTQELVKLQSTLEDIQSQFEAKIQESSKLQSDLEDIQSEFRETKEMLIKEQDVANKAAEEVQMIRGTYADNAVLIDELSAENKRLKALEEAKGQENSKLQSAMEDTQVQLIETKEWLIKEQKAAMEVEGDELPVVQEVSVVDAKLIELLAENEKLKALVEAKTQENTKLQSALEVIRIQLNETKEGLNAEQGSIKKGVEELPSIAEAPVVNSTLIEKLLSEYEKLKTSEEAKTQENANLLSILEELQNQFKETKVLVKDPEDAKKMILEIAAVADGPMIDTASTGKLSAENERLNALVSALEAKIDGTEKKYQEASKSSEERLKKAVEAEAKVLDLNKAVQRLKEKLSIMESEGQILRRLASVNSPATCISEDFAMRKTLSNNNLPNGRRKTESFKSQSSSPVVRDYANSDPKLRRSNIQGQHVMQESVDALIACVTRNIGFSQGKPIAAVTMYKCLLRWKSFEAEKTSIFDRLIQIIGSAMQNEENKGHMAYWFSNSSSLLFLLQRSLRDGTTGAQKPPPPSSLFERMTQGFRSSASSTNLLSGVDVIRQVEAKYPALLFKEQLTAYVETMYGIMRDNAKKELTPLLSLCIQARVTFQNSD